MANEDFGAIYATCAAYQSGFDHGLALDRTKNPYPAASSGHEAYAIGYAKGAEKIGASPGMRLLGSADARSLWPFEVALLRQDLQEAVQAAPTRD